jgi:hypothetical protein
MTTLGKDLARWLRATGLPVLVFAVALVLLAGLADRHAEPAVVGLAVVLIVAACWLGHVSRQERQRTGAYRSVVRARLGAVVVVLGLGALLLLWSIVDGGPEALGFAGLGLVVVSLGGVISEARQCTSLRRLGWPVGLGLAFGLVVVAATLLAAGLWVLLALLVAVVLAELGGELLSEAHLAPTPWRLRRAAVLAAFGAGLLVVGGALLYVQGAGLGGVVLLALIITVLVLMAASDSDSLLVVLVIAAALVWANAPRGATPAPGLEPVPGQPYALVLGDSYISGEGADEYYEGTNTTVDNADATNQCRRAPTAWPVLLAESGGPMPSRLLFLACSGAETRHILGTAPARGPAELVQYEREEVRLGRPPEVVLLSVGGNDAGFGTIGQNCVGPGDCSALADQFLARLRAVGGELDRSYAAVRAAVGPEVPVIAVPYPMPLTGAGSCDGVFLTGTERFFIATFVDQLDQVVQAATARAGFLYLSPMKDAFTSVGADLCGSARKGLNFLDLNAKAGSLWTSLNPTNWVHNSFHPNEHGHELLAQTAAGWLVEHQPLVSPPSVAAHDEVPAVEDLFPFGAFRLCQPGDASCDLDDNGWLNEQVLGLVRVLFLPLVLLLTGAWMVTMLPLGLARRYRLSSARIFLECPVAATIIVLGLGAGAIAIVREEPPWLMSSVTATLLGLAAVWIQARRRRRSTAPLEGPPPSPAAAEPEPVAAGAPR